MKCLVLRKSAPVRGARTVINVGTTSSTGPRCAYASGKVRHIWGEAHCGENGGVLSVLGSIEGAANSGVNHVNALFRVCRYSVVFHIVDIPYCTPEGVVAVQGELEEFPHTVF